MTASGTAGHGDELAAYLDLASLGAVVVKSLSAEPWPGNPAPRVHETPAGMINSVGLQGPGVAALAGRGAPGRAGHRRPGRRQHLGRPRSRTTAAPPSCWPAAPDGVVAVEVNVSCPNHHDRDRMFAHAPGTTAEAVAAAAGAAVGPGGPS